MAPKYDLIVVGAGPGGTAAAKFAAEKKLKVLLLERGRTAGDKQMSGSYLFRNITEEVFPGFVDAPMHKGQIRIAGIDFRWMLDNDEKRYGVSLAPGADAMRNWMTVYRNETDKWFAEQAVKAGVELKTALVTDLLWENQGSEAARVKGVVTDAGSFEAPVTIDASGLNSLIAHRSGLVKWDLNKVMLGLKYIYRVDEKVLRERLQTYFDTDGVEVDWGASQMICGTNPEMFGAHATGMPGRGIVSICFYSALKDLVQNRVNAHQRAQWYLNQPTCKRLIEGGEFIYCNVHALAAGDMVGYVPKSYLPGLLLVGDAGGFAQPLDNFGANVALWMGRMAGELCAEMKEKKDYSEAMFAKYEKTWRDSWVGEDDVHEISMFTRLGGMNQIFQTMDDVVSYAFINKWENKSYPSIILGVMPKLLPALPSILEMGNILKSTAKVGLKKADPFMQMLGMLSAKK